MNKLKNELNTFISTISKEEMKYNHQLREKVVMLQELMRKSLSFEKRKGPSTVLNYLDRDSLLKS